MIKVAITDDHPMVLTGLQQMLEDCDIELAGIYLTGAELLSGLEKSIPDVLLLDLQLPDIQGEELCQIILKKYPSIRILILSSIDVTYRVKTTLQLGCAGYSLKNVSRESLLEAIETVYRGEEYIEPCLNEEMLKELQRDAERRNFILPAITRREKEILSLLSEGNTSQQIANKLYLSIRTIENHRKNLLHKFDVKNTIELLNSATLLGLFKAPF